MAMLSDRDVIDNICDVIGRRDYEMFSDMVDELPMSDLEKTKNIFLSYAVIYGSMECAKKMIDEYDADVNHMVGRKRLLDIAIENKEICKKNGSKSEALDFREIEDILVMNGATKFQEQESVKRFPFEIKSSSPRVR